MGDRKNIKLDKSTLAVRIVAYVVVTLFALVCILPFY